MINIKIKVCYTYKYYISAISLSTTLKIEFKSTLNY